VVTHACEPSDHGKPGIGRLRFRPAWAKIETLALKITTAKRATGME
jgi:hypothetical protein